MSAKVSIPRGPADVTCEWLSSVLSSEGGVLEVGGVFVEPIGTGQTGATYRVSATYESGRRNLPSTFVIKLPLQDDALRDRVVLGYRSECAFYASVADRVRIPAPECFHCEINDDATEFALLLADQTPAVQGDQIAGCGRSEALLAATAIAGLHGPTWCDPEWITFPGLAMTTLDEAGSKMLGDVARMSADITLKKLAGILSAEDAETHVAAMSVVAAWLRAHRVRFSLIHGDYRLDNLLFDPDRTAVSVVDWQTLGVGLPARDVAYFAGTSLDVDLRRSIEDELVNAYYRALTGYGVSDYDRETCWQDYRFAMIQALLIPSLGCAFAIDSDRGTDMFAAMLQRGCQAVRDLGTLELVVAPEGD